MPAPGHPPTYQNADVAAPSPSSRPASSWVRPLWLWLAFSAALLAIVGSLVGLLATADIYGQETVALADAATAQDLVTLMMVAPLLAILGWRADRGHLGAYLAWVGCLAFTVYNYAIYCGKQKWPNCPAILYPGWRNGLPHEHPTRPTCSARGVCSCAQRKSPQTIKGYPSRGPRLSHLGRSQRQSHGDGRPQTAA